MYLIFDTETTGLPRDYNAPLSDSDNWPRVVQIAWQLHDKDGIAIEYKNFIVKPEGFTIPFNAEQVHGISTAKALAEGLPLAEVMAEFSKAVEQAKYLAGHNIEFDLNICGAEYLRLQQENILEKKAFIDTKDESTDFCAIPGGRGGKFKWPKLEELHEKLFGTRFAEAHNACADVEATARCFFELCRLGVIKRQDIAITIDAMNHLNEIAPLILNSLNSKNESHSDSSTKKFDTEKAKIVIDENIKFSHLHNHTQYSVLQSTSSVKDIVKKAIDYNCPAVALTDHGNMYGAFKFWAEIDKHNKGIKSANAAIESGEKEGEIKPFLKAIIGCELNICRDHKDKSVQDNGYTQVFLAKNKEGYQNISKLSSIGFIDGSYYVPRIDKSVLANYTRGIIATTGSLTGEIPNLILNVGETQAEEAFKWWHELFGEDFYVELNRHGLKEEDHVNEILLGFAKKYGVKYFAANSNYYIDKKNAKAHDVLLCVKDGEKVNTPIGKGRGFRFGFANQEFYFKSPTEMAQSFHDLPEAIETTNEIVNKIEAYKLERDVLLPAFVIAEDFIASHSEDIEASFNRLVSYREKAWTDKNLPQAEIDNQKAELRRIAEQFIFMTDWTWKGAAKRYPDMTLEIKERIEFELNTIEKMGYPGYFLIVADFIAEARRLNVSVGPGRGSAAGSVIAFCMWITNVDPIKYDLLFERFLNPDRISMPDIDIDFDDEGRGRVIDYVINKYGANQVAQIITYGTMGGKSAIRDAARALDLPLAEADKLAKSFPDNPAASLRGLLKQGGIDTKLYETLKERREQLEQAEAFIKIALGKDALADTLNQAFEIEGSVRNTGTHACGVIITPDDITKFVPITKAKDSNMLVTQFDNSVAESAGLLKMDFLGLRTLTIIKDALALIKQRFGIDIDIDAIPLDDKKTYELFQRGETNGVFQFESPGMQKHMKDLKPDSFTDLIAMNALYRPGPLAYIPSYIKRKHGVEKVVYELEGMEEFLSETYGITVYQEQVMRLSQKLAGFTKGDADVLRKAMGKKQLDVLNKMKSKYLEGCKANNHDTKVAEKVWTDWEAFASYAFNKSHSTCYAYVAFQTAYLKAHYPAEFMASVLNHSGNIEKITFFMEECKSQGIQVLGPDVNESQLLFSVTPEGIIRFGMASIKGVGENAVQAIVEERNANGKYKSVFDVARRVNLRAATKKAFEGLAYAGGFDSFTNTHRAQYFNPIDNTTTLEKIIKYGASFQESSNSAQVDMFGEASEVQLPEPQIPPCEEWGNIDKLRFEKEVVGMYLSGHPLDMFKLEMNKFCTHTINDFKDLKALRGKEVSFAGTVTSAIERVAKNGNPFGNYTIEDFDSSLPISLFSKDYIEHQKHFIKGNFLYVKGRIAERWGNPDELELKITGAELLGDLREKLVTKITIQINLEDLKDELMLPLVELINKTPGKCTLEIEVYDIETNAYVELFSKKFKVDPSDEFMKAVRLINPAIEMEFNKIISSTYLQKLEKLKESVSSQSSTETADIIESEQEMEFE